jgi:hypothetical protein
VAAIREHGRGSPELLSPGTHCAAGCLASCTAIMDSSIPLDNPDAV